MNTLSVSFQKNLQKMLMLFCVLFFASSALFAQGVTKSAINGIVTDNNGNPLPGTNVVAVHVSTNTQYGAAVRSGGTYNIPHMRVGGPYTVTASFIGYKTQKEENIFLSLGQTVRVDFKLEEEVLMLQAVEVVTEVDEVMNSSRTGAATFINQEKVVQLPSIKRSRAMGLLSNTGPKSTLLAFSLATDIS